MEIRLLAFDLDGTALTEDKHLSPATRSALERAAARGISLVPASGRMKGFLPQEVTSLPGVRYAITANGAGVYNLETGEAVWRCLMPNEKALQVQEILDSYDVMVEYYHEGRAIARKRDTELAAKHFHLTPQQMFVLNKDYIHVDDLGETLRTTGLCPEKINLPFFQTPAQRQEALERLEALGGLVITSSFPGNLEVNVEGADKGCALEALARILGVPQEQVMALGDNGNDLAMLRYAGVSVAMGNGTEEAKAAAKYVTAPLEEEGFAQAVERFALG